MQPSTQASKALTLQQLRFANSLVRGESQIQAYREAYPTDTSNTSNQHCNAYRLSRHPQIQALLKDTNDAVAETLTDDIQATKRFILRQLFALSKQGNQDCTKIKALELLGKACGLFNPAHAKEEFHQDLKQTLRQRLSEFEDAV